MSFKVGKKTRTSLILLLVVLFVFSIVGCGNSGQKQDNNQSQQKAKEEIVIGCVGAMTGPSAQLGNNLKYGVTVAIDEINANGGVNGAKLRAIFRDDEADPTKSLSLTRELVEKEKIDLFIGPVNTTCCKAIQPYLNQQKILHLIGGCTGTALIDEKQFPYSFRTHITDRLQAQFMANWAIDSGYKKIAMVHDTSALGMGAKEDMMAVFTEAGVEPVADVTYNVGDVDMLPAAQKIKDAGADAALLFTLAVDGARIVNSLEKVNYLPPNVALHGYTCLGQPAFRELAGKNAEGVLCNTAINCSYLPGEQPNQRVLDVISKMEKTFGENAANEVIVGTMLFHYDIVYILQEAIEKAGGSLNSDDLKTAMEQISSFEGVACNYSFAPDKHNGMDMTQLKSTVVTKNIKGCFELAQ